MNPFGTGLGGFSNTVAPSSSEPRDFVHNIVLEALLEGGWLAGLYLVLLISMAHVRSFGLARQFPTSVELVAVFAVMFSLLLQSLVSGEINDSRLFLAFLGLGLGLRRPAAPEPQRTKPARMDSLARVGKGA